MSLCNTPVQIIVVLQLGLVGSVHQCRLCASATATSIRHRQPSSHCLSCLTIPLVRSRSRPLSRLVMLLQIRAVLTFLRRQKLVVRIVLVRQDSRIRTVDRKLLDSRRCLRLAGIRAKPIMSRPVLGFIADCTRQRRRMRSTVMVVLTLQRVEMLVILLVEGTGSSGGLRKPSRLLTLLLLLLAVVTSNLGGL